MLKSNCVDTECEKYNEEMHCNCESYGWDYVDTCHMTVEELTENNAIIPKDQ